MSYSIQPTFVLVRFLLSKQGLPAPGLVAVYSNDRESSTETGCPVNGTCVFQFGQSQNHTSIRDGILVVGMEPSLLVYILGRHSVQRILVVLMQKTVGTCGEFFYDGKSVAIVTSITFKN